MYVSIGFHPVLMQINLTQVLVPGSKYDISQMYAHHPKWQPSNYICLHVVVHGCKWSYVDADWTNLMMRGNHTLLGGSVTCLATLNVHSRKFCVDLAVWKSTVQCPWHKYPDVKLWEWHALEPSILLLMALIKSNSSPTGLICHTKHKVNTF